MSKTIGALYDGHVLRPEEPLNLRPNTRVRITIESPDADKSKSLSFLATARKLNLDGPPDCSARIEDYLYGKRVDDGD
jgi:predicted DNA-binding antitoxin AbrB/MazE fold protein